MHVEGEAVASLARQPNVHFLGGKRIGELPGYTQHLDVCAMYYALNDYTKFIYPLKLHEYLATGRPVHRHADTLAAGLPPRDLPRTLHRRMVRGDTARPGPRRQPPRAGPSRHVGPSPRSTIGTDSSRTIARTLCKRLGPDELERFDATVTGLSGSLGHVKL